MAYVLTNARDRTPQPASESAAPAFTPDRSSLEDLEDLLRRSTSLKRAYEASDEQLQQSFHDVQDSITSSFGDLLHKITTLRDIFRRRDWTKNKWQETFTRLEFGRRFQELNRRIDKLELQVANMTAANRNGSLRRVNDPISLIMMPKPSDDPNNFALTAYHLVPTDMEDTYMLAQRAKGLMGSCLEGSSDQDTMREALTKIEKLAKFYEVVVRYGDEGGNDDEGGDDDEGGNDDEGGSDATKLPLTEHTVDKYMEALLATWGMDWTRVQHLAERHMQNQAMYAGIKREGSPLVGEEKRVKSEMGEGETSESTTTWGHGWYLSSERNPSRSPTIG